MTQAPNRVSSPSISRLFVDRWSPRSFLPESITEAELLTLIEAARWAPSAYNSQTWRFVYALRDTQPWSDFLSWLIPFNQSWAKNASALIYVVSSETTTLPGKTEPSPIASHAFDAGAAALQLVLQAKHAGWAAHTMSGLDAALAGAGLGVPGGHAVHAAIAIGRQGPADALPEAAAARENPSGRLDVSEIAFAGKFPNAS